METIESETFSFLLFPIVRSERKGNGTEDLKQNSIQSRIMMTEEKRCLNEESVRELNEWKEKGEEEFLLQRARCVSE